MSRTRESGMPSEDAWESFFHPDAVLRLLGLSEACGDVVEFGCGYGTFTIPTATIVASTVYALDIDPEMVRCTANKAKAIGLQNVAAIQCDFLADELPMRADYAMLFNILHAEQPGRLLECAKAILRPGGLLGIMHWNYDPNTPRGPSMSIRPKPEDLRRLAEQSGFSICAPFIDLPPWHYGVVAVK
jgi:SAM-dependent methyltransferase